MFREHGRRQYDREFERAGVWSLTGSGNDPIGSSFFDLAVETRPGCVRGGRSLAGFAYFSKTPTARPLSIIDVEDGLF